MIKAVQRNPALASVEIAIEIGIEIERSSTVMV
jgi:hypothetical protein